MQVLVYAGFIGHLKGTTTRPYLNGRPPPYRVTAEVSSPTLPAGRCDDAVIALADHSARHKHSPICPPEDHLKAT